MRIHQLLWDMTEIFAFRFTFLRFNFSKKRLLSMKASLYEKNARPLIQEDLSVGKN